MKKLSLKPGLLEVLLSGVLAAAVIFGRLFFWIKIFDRIMPKSIRFSVPMLWLAAVSSIAVGIFFISNFIGDNNHRDRCD